MEEIAPELKDIVCKYVPNSDLKILLEISLEFHVASEIGLKYRKYFGKCVELLVRYGDLEGVKFVHEVVQGGEIKFHEQLPNELYTFPGVNNDMINVDQNHLSVRLNGCVPILFLSGFDYTKPVYWQFIAIDYAAYRGNREIVKYLYDNGYVGLNALPLAVTKNHLEIVKITLPLWENNLEIHNHAFYWACRNKNVDIIQYLLENHFYMNLSYFMEGFLGYNFLPQNPDRMDQNLVIKIMMLFREHGVIFHKTWLDYAIRDKYTKITCFLHKTGLRLSNYEMINAVHNAMEENDQETLQYFLNFYDIAHTYNDFMKVADINSRIYFPPNIRRWRTEFYEYIQKKIRDVDGDVDEDY